MLDPAPGDCPAMALLQDFDPITFDPGVGASPVWVTGFVVIPRSRSSSRWPLTILASPANTTTSGKRGR